MSPGSTTRRNSVLGALLCLGVLLPVPPLAAQVVSGSVVERTVQTAVDDAVTARSARPVPGATVSLLDSLYARRASVETDAEGRFRLEAPGPGTWVLLLERPGHANELSSPLTLGAGEVRELRMEVEGRTVERMAALSQLGVQREALTEAVLDACGGDAGEDGRAILTGIVRDSTSGVALPGVTVVAEWGEEGGRVRAEARSRSDGGYIACGLPAGEPVTLAVREVERGAPLVELVLERDVAHALDLPVEVSTFAGAASVGQIFGRVMDEVGEPVEGAEVRLEGGDGSAVTNARGVFVLPDVPAGPQVLLVRHLGHGTQERALVVRGGRAHDAEIRLVTDPIELEPITVTVRPTYWFRDMASLQHRMDLGFGHFLTREDFEVSGAMPLSWIMSRVPGVDVRDYANGVGAGIRFRRTPRTAACRFGPVVYLDGVKFQLGQMGFDEFNTSELEVVELYARPPRSPGSSPGATPSVGWSPSGRGGPGRRCREGRVLK